jgi:arabinose-5-phosphate isomerase
VTGAKNSFLAKNADHMILAYAPKEACPNNLAPTASTTAQLAIGDAIAICLLRLKGFTPEDFAKIHPGGSIGKKIYLKVGDICESNTAPLVLDNDPVKLAIIEITEKRLGATAVKNKNGKLVGIITDGDIRRMIEEGLNIEQLKVSDIMNKSPLIINKNELAINALSLIRNKKVSQIIVTDKDKYFNILHFHDLIREGIV